MKKRWLSLLMALTVLLPFVPAEVRAEAAKYPAYFMGEQITSETKDDLLNDNSGSIKYVPAEGGKPARIILNNAKESFDGVSSGSREVFSMQEDVVMEIRGKNELSVGYSIDNTFFLGRGGNSKTVTFEGDGSLKIMMGRVLNNSVGIHAAMVFNGPDVEILCDKDAELMNYGTWGTLTMNRGSLKVTVSKKPTEYPRQGIALRSEVTLNGGKLEAYGASGAFGDTAPRFNNGVGGVGGFNPNGSDATAFDPENMKNYRYVKFWNGGPQPLEKYPVWVEGIQVTNQEGKLPAGVTYAPKTDSRPAILALQNATLAPKETDGVNAAILAKEPLIIKLLPGSKNKISVNANSGATAYGIVTKDAEFSLNPLGAYPISVDSAYGSGLTILMNGNSAGTVYGIYSSRMDLAGKGELTIDGAKVSEESRAIRLASGYEDIVVNDTAGLYLSFPDDVPGWDGHIWFKGGTGVLMGAPGQDVATTAEKGLWIQASRERAGAGLEKFDKNQFKDYRYLLISEPEPVDVTVMMVWENDDIAERPKSVEVALYKNGAAEGSPVALSADNGWSHTWKALAGDETWTVDEPTVPEGYEKTVTNTKDLWMIRNSKTETPKPPEPIKTIDVSVEKVWKGDDAAKRPASVEVALYKDGKPEGAPVVLNAANGWKHEWKALDASFAWTVDEPTVPEGYEKTVTNTDHAWTITNEKKETPKPPQPIKTVNVSVEKVWKGDDAAKRPASVEVALYKDGKPEGAPVVLNAANGWKHEWKALDASFAWTVDEPTVPEGYDKSVSNQGTAWTISNELKKAPASPDKPDKPGNPDKPGKPDKPVSPKKPVKPAAPTKPRAPRTGDAGVILWTVMAAASAAGLMTAKRKRRKKED